MGGLRLEALSRRAAVLLALALAFFLIGRTTGSGWVVVLLCGLLATLASAVALPALALARVEVSALAPRDATASQAITLELTVHRGGGLRVRVADPPGEWLRVDGPGGGEVLVVPARRGVFDAVDVDTTSAAPLGLVRWRRRLRVRLPAPLEVGPRPFDVRLPLAAAALTGAEDGPWSRLGEEGVRSVREYMPGDPARLVHWPSTARWGELMVKELETSDAPHLAIVVDLSGEEGAGEEAASRAAGLARAALRAGLAVTMLTAEPAGPAAGAVTGAAEAGRRLARAVAGPPAEGPVPPGAAVVRLTPSAGAGPAETPGRV